MGGEVFEEGAVNEEQGAVALTPLFPPATAPAAATSHRIVDSPLDNMYYPVMYIEDFIWLPDIIEKLFVKHHVLPEEAEEVFFNQPRFRFVEKGYRADEDVYLASGRSDAGRYLSVFFISKVPHTALILSARDMDRKERKRYDRKK